MQHKLIQSIGIAWTILFAGFIIWIYATEPRNFKEVTAGAQAATGTYEIDQARFNAALELFHREQFRAARDEWGRADPGRRDARTQFYIAYAFYREGWGRLYHDNALFQQGLEVVNLAIELAPDKTLTIDDPDLQMHTAAELKAELEQGTERSVGDLNPFKIFRKRK
jgi:tetratricopeptide (TPR) repeat protein